MCYKNDDLESIAMTWNELEMTGNELRDTRE